MSNRTVSGGKLDAEEKALLKAFEQGELKPVRRPSKKALVESARNTFKKDKRVNIRISGADLARIQERAAMEGIPYQTLMSSVLHKYLAGRLQERES